MTGIPSAVLAADRRAARWPGYARLLALWSVPAILMILQMEATAFISRRPFVTLPQAFPAVVEWLVWVPATPFIVGLARRFPVWPRISARAALVHACGVAIASLLRATVYSAAMLATGAIAADAFLPYLTRVAIGWLPIAVLVYGGVVAGAIALHYSRSSSDAHMRAADLAAALARAESAALRAQLDPHFLFNSLHSLGAADSQPRRQRVRTDGQ